MMNTVSQYPDLGFVTILPLMEHYLAAVWQKLIQNCIPATVRYPVCRTGLD